MHAWIKLVLLLVLPALVYFGMGVHASRPAETEEAMMLRITVNGAVFSAEMEDSASARAFASLLPMTLRMRELNGNEKYHYLESSLPAAPAAVDAIFAGDLMLFGDSCVVVFYDSFSTPYRYTRLGRIAADAQALQAALGSGDADVRFEIQQ